MAQRRLGAGTARALAGAPNLAHAVSTLHAGPYGRDVRAGMDLAQAQHAVSAAVLWHLRVLAGWLPPRGAHGLRVLAGGFELANVEEHVARLSGEPGGPAYSLGTLETAWSRLSGTTSLAGLADVLATTPWRVPDPQGRRELVVGLRLAWAESVVAGVPAAAPWARAAVALMLLRETALEREALSPPVVRRASSLLGPAFVDGLRREPADVSALRPVLPRDSRWALDGLESTDELWRAEARWWRRIEHDGFAMLRRSSFDQRPVVGAVAVLATDAWRVRAALEVAARSGSASALEVFDVVA
jgi:hypothetical protein